MKSRKQLVLCGVMTVFAAIVVWIGSGIKENVEGNFAEIQPPSDWIELYNFSDTSEL